MSDDDTPAERAFGASFTAQFGGGTGWRLAAEAARTRDLLARATPPAACGPDIPVAPARGGLRPWTPLAVLPGSNGAIVKAGFRGLDRHGNEDRSAPPRDSVVAVDVFDGMISRARKLHQRTAWDARIGGPAPFIPPFTPGQVEVARTYRYLTERHQSGGVKCASLETLRAAGGGAGGSFIDAFIAEGMALARLTARIGEGLALRRVRPSDRGEPGKSVPIRERVLVDRVCLGQQTLSAVLRDYGWSCKGTHREALRRALAMALDRMQGYRDRRPQNQG